MPVLSPIDGVSLAVRALADPGNEAWLTEAEREWIVRASSERRQRELRAGRAAAHEAMHAAKVAPTPDLLADPDGRPLLQPPSSWHISLAHDGPTAIAACATQAVGIDLVPLCRQPQVERVVQQCLDTRGAVPLAGEAGSWSPALVLWTGWEALGKQSGGGVLAGAMQERLAPVRVADRLTADLSQRRLTWWSDGEMLYCLASTR